MAQNARLLEIADELYGLELPAFTPARDARAKELKAEEKELSARVRALRKPSLAAWVVNVLVRRDAEQVEQVLAVGAALREAQANLDGAELRALTRQRRQLTAAVTTRARALARDLGVRVTGSVADQVEATLTAAMVDEECAGAVRSGLLVAPLASTGVGGTDVAGAVALPDALGFAATPRVEVPPARPELHVVPDPEADAKAIAAARDALEDAQDQLDQATRARDRATADVEQLEARSMQLQGEIDELRRRLADAETRAEEVDDELADAEDVKAEAEDALALAAKEHKAAAAALARLDN
ncbi:hypothetical protein [Nocardioides sp.]|uniref:hypothetical protein n=1 Tax=Nocardioides sp. TaxID=35761 RepID=UPI00356368C9